MLSAVFSPLLLSEKIKRCLVLIFLPILAYLIYFNSLHGEFIGDDLYLIEQNQNVHSISFDSIRKLFMVKFFDVTRSDVGSVSKDKGGYYRPLTMLSYAFEYVFSDNNIVVYHLSNIILHALCAVMLFYLALLIFGKAYYAFPAALFFLVHPLHSVHIASISGRTDLLVLFFSLSSLLFYAKYRRMNKSGKSLNLLMQTFIYLSFFLALLSKETGLFLPFVIVMHDLCFKKDLSKDRLKKTGGTYLWFALILGVYILMRSRVVGSGLFESYWYTTFNQYFWMRILTAFSVLADFLKTILFPLKIDYSWHYEPLINSLSDTRVIQAIVIFILSAGSLTLAFFKDKKIFFGLFFFFMSYFPAANIIPVWPSVSDKYLFVGKQFMHIPLVGLFIAVVGFYRRLLQKSKGIGWNGLIRFFWTWVGIAWVLFCIPMTVYHNMMWINPMTYNSRVLWQQPERVDVRSDMGLEFMKDGNVRMAEYVFKKAIDVQKDYGEGKVLRYQPYFNLMRLYMDEGKYADADKIAAEARRLFPNHAVSFYYSAMIKNALKEYETEIEFCIQTLSISPQKKDCVERLNFALDNEDYDISLRYRELRDKALDTSNSYAWARLGDFCRQLNLYRKAIFAYQKALMSKPDLYVAESNLLYVADLYGVRTSTHVFSEELNNSVHEKD